MRKTIQTLEGAVFVAGKGKKCANSEQALVNQHTELLTVLESQALKYQLDS
ncbi:hypothetical protein [Nostoc favosum]|uniref:Uncharacterized protein n=1 Tax=Nostoc favosum CHAB5714 TaxID=2780399 RepID=A0ABS8ICF0_9NOSO|nr:hypothetical protein [Nostoc favosum]MCC5601887.1 hypothetical protein [Nostoc favosum CHAB5714]